MCSFAQPKDASAAMLCQEVHMSERNGDRARFQKDRKRKLRRRQRIQELIKTFRAGPETPAAPAKVAKRPS
jgi:hypothetical protein